MCKIFYTRKVCNFSIDNYKIDAQRKESGGGRKWRHCVYTADKKRFTRIKRIVRAYDKCIVSNSSTVWHGEVTMQFPDYYSKSKHSFAKPADTYIKEILSE